MKTAKQILIAFAVVLGLASLAAPQAADSVRSKEERRGDRSSQLVRDPKNTIGFEFVTVGQRLRLGLDKEYETSAWVRWVDGPDDPPAAASATSAHPSVIVSFWARHWEGMGAFAGRDVWLFDNRWHKLTFRFCATDPDQLTSQQ